MSLTLSQDLSQLDFFAALPGVDSLADPSSFSDQPVALAVSGGADSIAMMHLFAQQRAQMPLAKGRHDFVFSVDHGVRKAAAAEVNFVLGEAEKLGFQSIGLTLPEALPDSSLQAEARAARYQVMARAMRAHQLSLLMTAHTLDDQVETFLMRLRRGSGLEGLAAMRPCRRFPGAALSGAQTSAPLWLLRPLLGVRKSALRAFLEENGLSWIDDPSNEDETFERVAVRRLVEAFDADGRFSAQVGRSVHRLGLAQSLVDEAVGRYLSEHVDFYKTGWGRACMPAFQSLSVVVQVGVVQRLLWWFGRQAGFSKVEQALGQLEGLGTGRFALAGVMFHLDAQGDLVFCREVGRTALEVGQLSSTQPDLLWDQRIVLSLQGGGDERLIVRAFTEREVEVILTHLVALPRCLALPFPQDVLRALAAVWRDEAEPRLIALPQLDDDGLRDVIFEALSGVVLKESVKVAASPLKL